MLCGPQIERAANIRNRVLRLGHAAIRIARKDIETTEKEITMDILEEETRKAYYDWTEDERHGVCHAWGIVHGCPGCPAMGSKPECPNKEGNE